MLLSSVSLTSNVQQHHPVAVSKFYEEQKPEAARKSQNIREERLPKFLAYFSSVIDANGSGYLVGDKVTCADLALFNVVDGICYAFPKCSARLQQDDNLKSAFELKKRIETCDELADYLSSERRLPHNNHDVFVSCVL